MPLSLYDEASNTKRALTTQPSVTLECAAVRGGPKGLGPLRQAVINDVLLRLFPSSRLNEAFSETHAELAAGDHGEAMEAEALRYMSLTVHYRAPLVLDPVDSETEASGAFAQLVESERQLAYLYATQKRLSELPPERVLPVQTRPSEALAGFSDALSEALEDDLDTPRALAHLQAFLLAVNAMCDAALRKRGRVNASAVDAAQAGFALVRGTLGLGADDSARLLRRVRDRRARALRLDITSIDRKVAARAEARAAKDFALADRLQGELLTQGIVLMDSQQGTSWTLA